MANPLIHSYATKNLHSAGIIDLGQFNTGYIKISSSTTIDVSVYNWISVVVPTLTSVTATLDSSKARIGMGVWVKRFDNLSVGNMTVASTSGNVQNPSTGLITGLLSLLVPSTISRVLWVWNGTDWEVYSAT